MDVNATHHLCPILCILAKGNEISEALLELAQFKGACTGRIFLVSGRAQTLQHDRPADCALVNGDDLVDQIDLNRVTVWICVVVVHFAGHARQHRCFSGHGRDERYGRGKAEYKRKQAFFHRDSSIRFLSKISAA